MRSAKKWIEVLSFDETGKPVFGGTFSLKDSKDSAVKFAPPVARYLMEYKKEGRARMNYDKEMDLIVFDHLVVEQNQADQPFNKVPDGDYQGFKWENGQWALVDKIFDFKLKDGQAPLPAPIKDATGKSDELKLLEQSERNLQRNQPPAKTPVKPPVKKVAGKKQAKDEDSY